MNIKSKLAILGLLVIIISLAGCMGTAKTCPVVVSQTEGVKMQRIEPSYFTVPVGDKINVYMDVQNRGNAPATEVSATLWAYTGFGLTKGQTKTIESKLLEPPRLDICSEGDVETFTWELRAGCDPVETILAVSLDYNYTSYGFAKIPLASRAEYERTQGELSAKGENFPSAGPLKIEIESIQMEPVLLGKHTSNFSARILFNNVGSGLVGPKGVGEVGNVKVMLSGPCKFDDSRNYATNSGKPTGAVPIIGSNDKGMEWPDGNVLLKSGKQEIMKIAYLKYDGDPSSFIEDICRVEVTATYRYNNVVSPSKRMGVYGSPSQISNCIDGDWDI